MTYRMEIGGEALAQLRALSREQRVRIGHRLDALPHGLQGDVKKLSGRAGKYRLRVGNFRILFVLEKDLIFVHQVKDRKDAYRD
jgi:mRNA interferase RelE/StbE